MGGCIWPVRTPADTDFQKCDNTGLLTVLWNTPTSLILRAINFNNPAATYPGQISYKANHAMAFRVGQQERMIISNNGVGIGTSSPLPGYHLDVSGPVRLFGNAAHFLAQATGGTNSWARFYMRSNSQSWFIGTSENFIGNQLYITDETNNKTRLSIQPGDGTINMQGNITQDVVGNGLPKAMVYLNSNGTIGRCYNGLTGATTGGCGFTSVWVSEGNYQINFPFAITSRFFAVSVESACCKAVTVTHTVFGTSTLNIGVLDQEIWDPLFQTSDYPVMVIVY